MKFPMMGFYNLPYNFMPQAVICTVVFLLGAGYGHATIQQCHT